MNLVDNLIKEGWLKTPVIIEAFQKIKREDFLPRGNESLAELNEALPIGWGQTISQPLVVAFMLELLRPEFGEKILDVGAGSGWTSTLLAYLVSQERNSKSQIQNSKSTCPNFAKQKLRRVKIQNPNSQNAKGKIVAIEIIPALRDFGKNNVSKYNFIDKGIVKFVCGDGSKGYKQEAPFDKILCSAEVKKELPRDWREQLRVKGKIVAPINYSIWLFEKKTEKNWASKEYPGFTFVPLI